MSRPFFLVSLGSILFLTSLVAQTGSLKTESFSSAKASPIKKPTISQDLGQPPKITYGASRQSTGWVIANGSQSAIDEGIEWQGRKAYLTLTYDLIVVDAKTNKSLWVESVGAFWNTITFANMSKGQDAARWAVVLGSSAHPDYQQGYELESGKKLVLPGSSAVPDGTTRIPRKTWSGSAGVFDTKKYQLVLSAEEWAKLRTELFGRTPKDLPEAEDIDFTTEVLLVCYAGKATNWAGISVDLAVENDERLLLRLHRKTYQSMGNTKQEHPYGLVVLPRSYGKDYVLEYNSQNLIGGPPMWKEFTRMGLKK